MIRSCLFFLFLLFTQFVTAQQGSQLRGSWTVRENNRTHLVLVADNYYSYAVFNADSGDFFHTEGGRWRGFAESPVIESITEFNSSDITQVKEKSVDSVFLNKFHFRNAAPFHPGQWKRTDTAAAALSGCWRISQRSVNGQMQTIPPGARKTIKLLTGEWFQWAAINTETGEFFGTGGGKYSFTPGRYTELIRFFSRDKSRVGLTLEFNDHIVQEKWDHQGKSSKGDPIHEVWVKAE